MKHKSENPAAAHAFENWRFRSNQIQADRLIDLTLKSNSFGIAAGLVDKFSGVARVNETGWLKIARTAMNLSGNEIAGRLGISRMSYSKAERRETDGAVSLRTMKRLADAMHCEFIYVIRPKQGTYSEAIWKSLAAPAEQIQKRQRSNCHRKGPTTSQMLGRAIAARACEEAKTPAVRQTLRWTERLNARLTNSRE